MAAEAASESILFIGSILAAGLVTGALTGLAGHYVDNLRTTAESAERQMTGRIALVNDPAHMPNGPLVLYVKNTGGHQQDLAAFAVLIDGQLQQTWTATVGGVQRNNLDIGELATITLTGYTAPAGDHTAMVISDTNSVARLSFTV